ncbi:MAG: endonuclease/exonuclease/phosphatase family protein [Trueperaceae bacterium]|nr:endonuclease/exonuclease/phosphatase family protein [Trueperaceae bacterium]
MQKNRAQRWLLGLSASLLLISLIARLGNIHWSADLLALFPDVYFYLALLLLIIGFVQKNKLALLFCLMCLILNGSLLYSYLPFQKLEPTAEPELRFYMHNLYYLNSDLETALSEINKYDPDIVFLMEYSEAIQAQIESAFTAYPYRLIEPSRYTMGLALFSRIPLATERVRRFPETRIPIFDISFQLGGETFSFVGAHPWPPLLGWGQLHRDQIASIARVASEAPHPLLVAGDFNASQWSYALRHLMQEARVQDAAKGFGLRKSWRYNLLFKLPLDHVMVSEGLTVLKVQHGQHGGSDHAPLIIDISLKTP